ncbi:RNA-binding domain-containing protein [Adlercreutzia shanghongiae]|uniref:RNA-binding domain-containing protein n=1 Tax=Adlercreutzia shanghongiae TaxID=3111773 RepID=A0ABU6J2G7_9ACTN|nr:RNA-binding domain-containing protein [Adlercreutzia sp. R22]MEC4296002.1 RNA-binding domain-containing protein [Adlercreutzia sp. R22]
MRCSPRERHTFETICSFANRQGGHILLGVNDDGSVEGVNEKAVVDIERNIVNVTSNPSLFNAAPGIELGHCSIQGKQVIDVWVPMGPSVYRYKGEVYDRIADVDVRLKGDDQVSALYLRKQNLYTEQRIYPYIEVGDLDLQLLDRARDMIRADRPEHPWLALSDNELLGAARLRTRDFQTGEEGFNLASVLLLGRRETILGVCPAYRTDAILKRLDTNRYDDRATVSANLIESYYQLSDFCKKWLPDAFALEGDRRVDARDIIVRELVSNTLIHREYTSPFVSQLVIDREGIRTKNASRCVFAGRISPDNLSPTPKNPIIANFFKQIGLAEELGSGTRNLFRCSRLYTGKEPVLFDGDFFEAFVPTPIVAGLPLKGREREAAKADRPTRVTEDAVRELLALKPAVTAKEVAEYLGANQRTVRRHLADLVEGGTLEMDRKGRSTAYRKRC